MEYSYFTLFSSIFLTLAVMQILRGFGALQKAKSLHGSKIKISLVHIVWIIVLLIVSFQYFVGQHQLYEIKIKYSILILLNLAIPGLIYWLTVLIIPELGDADVQRKLKKKKIYDLADFFDRHRKNIMLMAIILVICFAINGCCININLGRDDYLNIYARERLGYHASFFAILLATGFMKRNRENKKKEKHFWTIQFILALGALVLICMMAAEVIQNAF